MTTHAEKLCCGINTKLAPCSCIKSEISLSAVVKYLFSPEPSDTTKVLANVQSELGYLGIIKSLLWLGLAVITGILIAGL